MTMSAHRQTMTEAAMPCGVGDTLENTAWPGSGWLPNAAKLAAAAPCSMIWKERVKGYLGGLQAVLVQSPNLGLPETVFRVYGHAQVACVMWIVCSRRRKSVGEEQLSRRFLPVAGHDLRQ